MDNNNHFSYKVLYSLFVNNEEGKAELVEKTTEDHPYSFITGLGMCLEEFERVMLTHQEGEHFCFTIPVGQAYGEYEETHVLKLDKSLFHRNGKFDTAHIYPGAFVPMLNEDGNRLEGIVQEIKEDSVIMDFNHPLAGKELIFKGTVVSKQPATEEEIQEKLNYTHTCHCGGGGCGKDKCKGECDGECKNDCNCENEGGCNHCK